MSARLTIAKKPGARSAPGSLANALASSSRGSVAATYAVASGPRRPDAIARSASAAWRTALRSTTALAMIVAAWTGATGSRTLPVDCSCSTVIGVDGWASFRVPITKAQKNGLYVAYLRIGDANGNRVDRVAEFFAG